VFARSMFGTTQGHAGRANLPVRTAGRSFRLRNGDNGTSQNRFISTIGARISGCIEGEMLESDCLAGKMKQHASKTCYLFESRSASSMLD
jgi:hypothetical protein